MFLPYPLWAGAEPEADKQNMLTARVACQLQEAAREAMRVALRDEAEGKVAELQARQVRAAAAWEEREKERRVAADAEAAR